MENRVLNLGFWETKISDELLSSRVEDFVVPRIVGPFDLLFVNHLRKLVDRRFVWGKPEERDYLIWGRGEDGKVGTTRLGGCPDLPINTSWPKDRNGDWLPFIGQLNFANSRDLLCVPSGLLLIFGRIKAGLVEEFHLLWTDPSKAVRIDAPEMPPSDFVIEPHYAQVHRLEVFPQIMPGAAVPPFGAGLLIRSPYRIAVPDGCCIGHWMQDDVCTIASLTGVRSNPEIPYPLLNVELGKSREETLIERIQDRRSSGQFATKFLEFADYGVLTVCRRGIDDYFLATDMPY